MLYYEKSDFRCIDFEMALSKVDETPEFIYVEDPYYCIFCKDVLKNALMTECGHRICLECSNKLLKDQEFMPCPANEDDCIPLKKSMLYEDFSARRYINNILVYCFNKHFGCTVKLPYKDMLDYSKHLNNCECRQIQCANSGCSWTGSQQEVGTHVMICPFQMIKCKDCDTSIYRNDEIVHAEECIDKMVLCKYCENEFIQSQLSTHWKVCAEVPKECMFKKFGCSFQGNDSEMQEHRQIAYLNHTEYIALSRTEQDLEFANFDKDIKENSRNYQRLDGLCSILPKIEDDVEYFHHKLSTMEGEFNKSSNFENKKKFVNITERLIILDQDFQRHKDKADKQLQHLKNKESTADIQNLSLLMDQLMAQVTPFDRQIGMHDMRLEELNSKLTSVTHPNYDGEVMMKISNYSRWKTLLRTSKTAYIYSEPFYSSKYGYKMCAKVYLNGDGIGKGTHLSFYFTIMKGEYDNILVWPFQQRVTLTALDQTGRDKNHSDKFLPDPNSKSFHKPVSDYNIATGCPDFITQVDVESYPFMKDDTIFLKASIDTSNLR